MAEYLIQSETLTSIADAIREKNGSSGAIAVTDMPSQIASIQTGVELPTLTTPASDAEVFEGKQYIKQDGSAGTGAFTLTDEISAQDALIAQIQEALEGKSAASIDTCTVEFVGNVLSSFSEIFYTKYENGKMAFGYILLPYDIVGGYVLPNVVCGSNVVVNVKSSQYIPRAGSGVEDMATAESRPMIPFYITAGKGETAVINIVYQDF